MHRLGRTVTLIVVVIGALAVGWAVGSVAAPDQAHWVGTALIAVVASRVVVAVVRARRQGTGVLRSWRRHGGALRAAADARMVREAPEVPESDGRPSSGEPRDPPGCADEG